MNMRLTRNKIIVVFRLIFILIVIYILLLPNNLSDTVPQKFGSPISLEGLEMDEVYRLGAQVEGALGEGWAGPKDPYIVENRVYLFQLIWSEIETSPGIYVFPDYIQESIDTLNERLGENYQLILQIKVSPTFYSSNINYGMAPPKREYFQNFATFAEQVILKYDPWGIEVWNEPEFPLSMSKAPYYGGYGLDGGIFYGQTVRFVYDYLKGKGYSTNVIAGASIGTLHLETVKAFTSDAVSGGMKADYWSFHSYYWYDPIIQPIGTWEGMYFLSKEIYSVFPVPQIVTETSIMYPEDLSENTEHRLQQMYFLKFMIEKFDTSDYYIKSILWYTLANNGWRHTDMVFKEVEYPVYELWKNYNKDTYQYEIFLPIVIKP